MFDFYWLIFQCIYYYFCQFQVISVTTERVPFIDREVAKETIKVRPRLGCRHWFHKL